MSTALDQLTKPNHACAKGATNEPLLRLLEDMARGAYKKAGGGQVDYAPKLSDSAIRLHDEIKRDLRAYEQITKTTATNLIERTLLAHKHLNATVWLRSTAEGFNNALDAWATQILAMLDRTVPKPYKVTCPGCGVYQVPGTTRTALSLHIPDEEPDGTQPQGWLECSQCGWRKTRKELEREYA